MKMEQNSNSLFLESNGTGEISYDEHGNPCEGTRIGVLPDGKQIIMRFRSGLLDGDSYSTDGTLVVQPAVEEKGHIEYWRAGNIHRDNGLSAICSKGFTVNEFWENGVLRSIVDDKK